MHNCKLTRNSFVDLALDELPPARSTELLAELTDCQDCREEYATLGSTLHVSNQALRSALPGEEFWPGYRARLHAKLLASTDQQIETAGAQSVTPASQPTPFGARLWLALRTMATTYVRVPIPAALGVLLLFAALFVVQRWRGQVSATPSTPVALVRTHTVEVPVIQEKVITRVVYVEKKDRRSGRSVKHSLSVPIPGGPGGTGSSVAGMGSNPATGTALSLSGFKPTDEVKLTIIKGSYKDQKR